MSDEADKSEGTLRFGWILAALAAALLGIYVAGYFGLGQGRHFFAPLVGPCHLREFPFASLCVVYQPLADIEKRLSGQPVLLGHPQSR